MYGVLEFGLTFPKPPPHIRPASRTPSQSSRGSPISLVWHVLFKKSRLRRPQSVGFQSMAELAQTRDSSAPREHGNQENISARPSPSNPRSTSSRTHALSNHSSLQHWNEVTNFAELLAVHIFTYAHVHVQKQTCMCWQGNLTNLGKISETGKPSSVDALTART